MSIQNQLNSGNLSHQKIAILGSTGSIGTQALEIIDAKPELFSVNTLTGNRNYKLLAKQVNHFKPDSVVLCDSTKRKEFEALLEHKPRNILFGNNALEDVTRDSEYDLLLNSLVGFSGFMSTYNALKLGRKVALANKESLVVGGEIIAKLDSFKDGLLIPVDSEHSAMLQSLLGEKPDTIKKIIITASGGPFRGYSKEEMKSIKVEDALKHPNWDMGAKITIDSSTMMNKGLEIIEAKWLFNLSIDQIEPVIHPQSIIHSIIEFKDGSSKAQLGPPDMKVPILYALTYPDRVEFDNPTLDYTKAFSMDFEPVKFDQFPCIKHAIEASKMGGVKPVVLNAANEIAVERFLNKEIRYIDIPVIIEQSLTSIDSSEVLSPSLIQDIDKETREFSNALMK